MTEISARTNAALDENFLARSQNSLFMHEAVDLTPSSGESTRRSTPYSRPRRDQTWLYIGIPLPGAAATFRGRRGRLDLRDPPDLLDLRDLRDLRDVLDVLDLRDLLDLLDLLDRRTRFDVRVNSIPLEQPLSTHEDVTARPPRKWWLEKPLYP
ncbi:hypothetical protein G6O67_007612 [Ophiocordyceps sinensis]|uniref:Uncharacterized protein n=1 Tax=Ophiocordyceps sinensis TaxID=72228 RepID=A0A8H4PNY6_9HYPO|nr:hypothetical protein G6O67_007612 [Ophiocordyceps sinensis]